MDLLEAFAHPHWPDLSVVARLSPVIQIHLLAAFLAFAVATWQLIGPKGTIPHRVIGWTWVICMFIVAVSSFFIRDINSGGFGFIHILSVLTLAGLVQLVWAARRHNVKAHRGHAMGLYIGALVIAGIFTLLPGRAMWHIFFG